VISFETCDSKERATCKNDTEIAEWIKGKYLITAENTWTFRAHRYEENRLAANSKFNWFLLGSQIRSEVAKRFTVGRIELQDKYI